MEIKTQEQSGTLFIRVSGSVDTEAAEQLRTELATIIKRKPTKVVMDIARVPSIGSSGIGKILIFFKELDKCRASFEIKGIHENVYSIFKSIKLDKLFPITQR